MRLPFRLASRFLPVVILFLFFARFSFAEVSPAVEGEEGRRAFDDLTTYYTDAKSEPPFEKALASLGSKGESERKSAGKYLTALFAQSQVDETTGRSDWWKLPSWRIHGDTSRYVSLDFRRTLAEAFANEAQGNGALEPLLWLIRSETNREIQITVATVLPKIDASHREKILAELLEQPHPIPVLAEAAIKEVEQRKLTALSPQIRKLCGHYRTSIREAARQAAATMEIKDIPEYQAANAFTQWLLNQLENILEIPIARAPVDAKWYHFKSRTSSDHSNSEYDPYNTEGWLLSEDEEFFRVLTWDGMENIIPKKEAEKTDGKLADANRQFLEGSKNPSMIGLLAAWYVERGDRESAAKLLFPAIDRLWDDREILLDARYGTADGCVRGMLAAFCESRDYPTALRFAEHLSKPVFEGYEFQNQAKKLALQLKARANDFKEFRLPKAVEWEKQKETLSREDQIRTLLSYLRLLNCLQPEEAPGNVNYQDPQTAAPKEAGKEAVLVINPFVELLRLRLTVAELPLLLPSLTDENYIPAYTSWLFTGPVWTLHQVNWLVALQVNHVAQREIVGTWEFDALDKAAREKRLRELSDWCRANAGKSVAEMALAAMLQAKDETEFEHAMIRCIDEKAPDAVSLILSRRTAFPDEDLNIARAIYKITAAELAPVAREWLKSDDLELQFYAALTLLQNSDRSKNEGFAELKAVLSEAPSYNRIASLYPIAMELLLNRGDDASVKLALGILREKDLGLCGDSQSNPSISANVLNHLLRTGRREVLDNLRARLDGTEDRGNISGSWKGHMVKRNLTAGDEIASIVVMLRTDHRTYAVLAPAADRAKQRAELKDWLKTQIELIRAGKPAALPPLEPFEVPNRRLDPL